MARNPASACAAATLRLAAPRWRTHGNAAVGRRCFADSVLPPHAVELGGLPAGSSTGPGQSAALPGAPWQQLTILPVLHGLHGPGGAEDIAAAIRARAPRQVFVELCTARYAEVLSCAVLGLPARPPPRVDILGNIHGGLLGFEMIPVLQAAREVGAAIVPVDRTRAATRNRVGQKLLSPRFMRGLLRYGIYSLTRRRTAKAGDAESFRHELQASCPDAYNVLVAERSSYMAHQLRASAAPGADIFLACGVLHTAEIVQALRRDTRQPLADEKLQVKSKEVDLIELGRCGMPVWPVLTVCYVLIPGVVAFYAISAVWEKFGLEAMLDSPD